MPDIASRKFVETFQRAFAQSGRLSDTDLRPLQTALPLVLEGDGGRAKTVMVDPSKPFEVDAWFPVKRTKGDPERTVLAFVR